MEVVKTVTDDMVVTVIVLVVAVVRMVVLS